MPDFEAFSGFESTGEVDSASYEKFKERIKAAAAQIKALKKGEQKQRQKEEKLIQILLKFVKNHQKQDIMLLIARLLEQNVPAAFILSIVLLGNEEMFKDAEGKGLLEAGKKLEEEGTKALSFFDKEKVLPLEVKIKIDSWMKNILAQALDYPHRVLKTVFDEDESLILPLVQLAAFILRDFLTSNKQEADYEKLKDFSEFFLSGFIKNVQEQVKSRKELEENEK